jgi:predicted SAM-dependent methyltransferase
MKYHLGCGNKHLPGFLNIDCVKTDAVDLIDDISKLTSLEPGTADLIYACHCLEHFSRHEIKDVLMTWFSKLRCGGRIRIAVPDFDAVVNYYGHNRNLEQVMGLVCGGQRNEYDFHKVIFTFDFLQKVLNEVGFYNVKRYEWRTTEHSHIDDYSQCYLPHMQKDSGTLMSLNVEALKP